MRGKSSETGEFDIMKKQQNLDLKKSPFWN